MPKGRTLVAILIFVIALICSVVLEIEVLNNNKYIKAGIATLRVGTFAFVITFG
jgi:hypothetical protein